MRDKVYGKNIYNTGRNIYLCGEIVNPLSAELVPIFLDLQMMNPIEDITLLINSPGGEVDEMFAIIDLMNAMSCDIRTVVIGSAMSAAAFIAICGAKGKRFMTPHSRMMLHSVSGGALGSIHDMVIDVDEITRLNRMMISEISVNSSLTPEQAEELTKRDRYILPSEAIEMGLVDGVIKTLK
jgi:ATP-dependent Clp protease, protease subunit